MGIECTVSEINSIWKLYSHYPILSILNRDIILENFIGFSSISLGKDLSSALINYDKTNRKNYVIKELDEIISKAASKQLIFNDIDILFNPDYNIDILGYFVSISRNRKVIVLWPGEYISGHLVYAAQEYRDYKKYLIKDYNIILLR